MREGDGMPGAKAPRNKTIDTPLSAGGAYLERCVTVERPLDSIEELRSRILRLPEDPGRGWEELDRLFLSQLE